MILTMSNMLLKLDGFISHPLLLFLDVVVTCSLLLLSTLPSLDSENNHKIYHHHHPPPRAPQKQATLFLFLSAPSFHNPLLWKCIYLSIKAKW